MIMSQLLLVILLIVNSFLIAQKDTVLFDPNIMTGTVYDEESRDTGLVINDDKQAYAYWGYRTIAGDSTWSGTSLDTPEDCYPPLSNIDYKVKEYNLKIFDRFGNKVFETDDTKQPWICNSHHRINVKGGYYSALIKITGIKNGEVFAKEYIEEIIICYF